MKTAAKESALASTATIVMAILKLKELAAGMAPDAQTVRETTTTIRRRPS